MALRHLGRKLLLARFALLWERLWPALWPAVGIAGGFLALALFDVLPYLPAWLHGLILAAFLIAICFALWRASAALLLPEIPAARRRIERSTGLLHRPLTILRERQAAGTADPATRALWHLHRLRTIEKIRGLRVGLPHPGLARRDPLALRGALIVVLVIGLTIAWGDGRNRIARALSPGLGAASQGPAVLDVWITPPAYTGKAPIFLSAGREDTGKPAAASNLTLAAAKGPAPAGPGGGPIAIPEGSTVLAQLSGGWGTPHLVIGNDKAAFKQIAKGAYKITTTLGAQKGADRITVRQGATPVASWPIRLIPDRSPTVRFTDKPAPSARGALRIDLEGQDDYGITGAKLYIRRRQLSSRHTGGSSEDEKALAALNTPVVIDLPMPGAGSKTVKETSYHDLTANPWAGMPVTVQVVARDGAGQPGVTEAMKITLPERHFRHPVAQLLVLLRKRLTFDPSSRADVADQLFDLTTIPASFGNDTVAFLAIQSAALMLRDHPGLSAIPEVQGLLWDTALRIEDGQASLVEQRMREAQRKLMEALAKKAPNAEIQKLMNELQQAMSQFLKEMMKDMKNLPQTAQPFDPNTRYMTPQDLQRMLDRARELAMTGNTDAARQMLSMLREMLENLRSGRSAQSQQQRQQSQAWNMLRQLQDMLKRQQELMDRTYRQGQRQEGQQGQQGRQGQQGQQGQNGAQQQDALRRQLQDLLRKFGEMTGKVPQSLGDAELSMRDALEALRKGQPGDAVGPQGKAIEQMQKGAGQMLQNLMRQFGQGRGRGRGRGPGRGFAQRPGQMPLTHDPLGRPLPNTGMSTGDEVKIPDESDTQRARQILEELRRRASELGRPPIEMDYLERLLKLY